MERSCGQEAFCGHRNLRDAEQHHRRLAQILSGILEFRVFFQERRRVHDFSIREPACSAFLDLHAGEHLAANHLNVLVVYGSSLGSVNALNLAHDVALRLLFSGSQEEFLQIQISFAELLALHHGISLLHPERIVCGNGVLCDILTLDDLHDSF